MRKLFLSCQSSSSSSSSSSNNNNNDNNNSSSSSSSSSSNNNNNNSSNSNSDFFLQLRSHFGPRLTCLLPGVLLPPSERPRLPYCTRAAAMNDTDDLGYSDLNVHTWTYGRLSSRVEPAAPNLVSPRLGFEPPADAGRCPPRCSSHQFTLHVSLALMTV